MTLPNIRIQNTGAAQSNVPFTFGQVFAVGDLKSGEGLAGKMADGSIIALQIDQKVTHGDGSVRHAIVSGILSTLAKGSTAKFDLVKAPKLSASAHTWPTTLDAKTTIAVDGKTYTADLTKMWNDRDAWLMGNIVDELALDAVLADGSGVPHPLLTVRYAVRLYHATKQVRVEVIVENTSTFSAPARNFTYDVDFQVSGKNVYSKKALTHYHHARWHMYAWSGAEPAIHVQHDTAYLIASKTISNYDQSLKVPDVTIGDLRKSLPPEKTGPMTVGTCVEWMGTTGGRPDIGPLPNYSVIYLLTGDLRAREVMMANADGSGSWSMHYRDENTGYPLRTDTPATAQVSTHPNFAGKGPLPVPRFVSDDLKQTPYGHDVAHHPSLAYLPYLLTGDRYYLEELQFWAAYNPIETDPGNNGNGAGLLRWHQVRGQAWALRTLGHAAYATPDDSPMKAYFVKQVANNLDYYTNTFVVKNPNKLGAYDGSGDGMMELTASPPWQDDFVTWAFGYLNELGFAKAKPILEWKSKYPIGRLTAPGFCWIAATAYTLAYKEVAGGPVVDTFAKLYQINFGGHLIRSDDGVQHPGPVGKKYIDLPCGGPEQAAYLDSINGNYGWPVGKMMGYADSAWGMAANMQPGLAQAVTVNADGPKAWSVFMARNAKPDYSINPQWAIIPRDADVVVSPPVTPPVPPVVTPPAKKGKITVASNVNLKKMSKLLVKVFNPVTFELIRAFDNVTANSKGGFVLEDAALVAKTACAYTVIDAKGKALVINLTTII